MCLVDFVIFRMAIGVLKNMNDTVNVVICPYCGDTWITDNSKITEQECLCFRCNNKYFPDKIYKMWYFVYNAVKTVKGH